MSTRSSVAAPPPRVVATVAMEVSLGAAGPPPHTGKGGGSARRAPGSLRGALEQRQPPSGAGDDVHVLEHPSGPRTISGGRRGMHDKTTQSPTELSTISEPHASVTPQERRSRSGCNTSSALGISRLQQDLISLCDQVIRENPASRAPKHRQRFLSVRPGGWCRTPVYSSGTRLTLTVYLRRRPKGPPAR